MSSVGVTPGSILSSRGLLTSEDVVTLERFPRDDSRPAGYERGSARRILDREDEDEAIDGVIDMSLFTEAVEKVDAIERRDLQDDAEEEVALELVVEVDMKEEATELRPVRLSARETREGRTGRRTRVHGLREHPLDEVWRMPREQSLDVLHRLLGDVVVVVHCGDGGVGKRG